MCDEFLELVGESLRHDFDRKIRRVAYMASQCQVSRVLRDEIAIENALHFPSHNAPNLFNFHVRGEGFEPPAFAV